MSKLPLLTKNAYLSISILNGSITSHLAYSHYEIGRSYILHEFTDLRGHDISAEDWKGLLEEYLIALGDRFEWKLFLENSFYSKGLLEDQPKLFSVYPFEDEGVGLSGVRFSISDSVKEYSKVVNAVRSLCPEAKTAIINDKYTTETLNAISRKLGYEDMLFLDLNLFQFDIYRVIKKVGRVNLADINKPNFDEFHCRIKWDNPFALADQIKSSKLKAFMSLSVKENILQNAWANFVTNPSITSSSRMLSDVIRSYITVQLLSMFNDHIDKLKLANTEEVKTGILVTGDILSLVEPSSLWVALFDGLQLDGAFDLITDINGYFKTYGRIFGDGINSSEFILSRQDIFNDLARVYIPTISGVPFGQRKVIFSGEVVSGTTVENTYFIAPEIQSLNLKTQHDMLSGSFIREAYIKGLGEKISFINGADERFYKKIIFDSRIRPVIYGPDASSNTIKMNGWFNE